MRIGRLLVDGSRPRSYGRTQHEEGYIRHLDGLVDEGNAVVTEQMLAVFTISMVLNCISLLDRSRALVIARGYLVG